MSHRYACSGPSAPPCAQAVGYRQIFVIAALSLLVGCQEDIQLLAPGGLDAATPVCQTCIDGVCQPVPDGSACHAGVCLAGVCESADDGCQSTERFARVSAGGDHTCAVDVTGQLLCTGDNLQGQLGLGDRAQRSEPGLVAGGPWQQVDAGRAHTCGQVAGNTSWCTGDNDNGQLGIDAQGDRDVPTEVVGGAIAWSVLAAGWRHTCGVSIAGELWCWGNNQDDILGAGPGPEHWLTPQQITQPAREWRTVTAGADFTCAIDWAGGLWCWGQNEKGVLGVGGTTTRATPTQVASTTAFAAVAAGEQHACALDTAGGLWCWGDNDRGQLGLGGVVEESDTPRSVSGGPFVHLASGARHSCAIAQTGVLSCWGENSAGQLGLGDGNGRNTPTQVAAVGDWIHISGGRAHTCGIRQSSALFCWGENSAGQLGLADLLPRDLPTRVCGAPTVE